MCTYTIIATITKIERAKLYFRGVGDCFRKDNEFFRNILASKDDLKVLKLEESWFELKDTGNLTSDAFYRELLVHSMLDRKKLKLEFELDNLNKVIKLNGVAMVDC